MRKVLEGVKVVELTTHAAAPMTGRILADLGADVIKIEAPSGDNQRLFGLSCGAPVSDDENPCFQLMNANKRGITLNLKMQEGRELLYDLLKDANIFFTNTRRQALEKLQITYEDLAPKFPHLIYGHISGLGLKGEEAKLPGYDITAYWARGGGLADFALEGNGPIMTPYAVGDHTTSLALAAGLTSSLYKQKLTGEGEYVLVSLYGVSVYVNSLILVPAQDCYNDKWPKSKYSPLTPITNTYICADGEMITLTILDYERDWAKFCKMIQCEDLIDDERYNTRAEAKKLENSKYLVDLISDIFKQHDRAYWMAELSKYDLPYGKTVHLSEVTKDPLAWENGYLSEFTFENGNKCVIPNTPIQFRENVAAPCGPCPHLGEHSREIMRELGYGEEKIQKLLEMGASTSYR